LTSILAAVVAVPQPASAAPGRVRAVVSFELNDSMQPHEQAQTYRNAVATLRAAAQHQTFLEGNDNRHVGVLSPDTRSDRETMDFNPIRLDLILNYAPYNFQVFINPQNMYLVGIGTVGQNGNYHYQRILGGDADDYLPTVEETGLPQGSTIYDAGAFDGRYGAIENTAVTRANLEITPASFDFYQLRNLAVHGFNNQATGNNADRRAILTLAMAFAEAVRMHPIEDRVAEAFTLGSATIGDANARYTNTWNQMGEQLNELNDRHQEGLLDADGAVRMEVLRTILAMILLAVVSL
jgi:hypothetical protein